MDRHTSGRVFEEFRTFLIAGVGFIETVDRVETQVLAHQDDRLGANNSIEVGKKLEGSVDGGDGPGAILQLPVGESNPEKGEEEDEVSAWGLDAEADEDSSKVNSQEDQDLRMSATMALTPGTGETRTMASRRPLTQRKPSPSMDSRKTMSRIQAN